MNMIHRETAVSLQANYGLDRTGDFAAAETSTAARQRLQGGHVRISQSMHQRAQDERRRILEFMK